MSSWHALSLYFPTPLNKQILRLAIPNILSNLAVPMMGLIDTAMMGHIRPEIYLGAIAVGGVIFSAVYWSFGFLRMGTTGMTAQAYGKGDERESLLVLARALCVALIGAVLMMLLQEPIIRLAMLLIKGEADVKMLAQNYFYIRIYAAPATIGLFAFHGWFLGMQNARYPMWLTIFVSLLNVAFNALFVFHFGMKSDGVALGTVLAQYGGLALALLFFFTRYRHLLPHFDWQGVLHLPSLRHFFTVNGDIFIRTACLVFVFAFHTSESSGMDPLVLAANSILLQYFHFMAYGVDGFALAAESLIGKYAGEGETEVLRKVIRRVFVWGLAGGLLFALAYLLAGEPLLSLMTNQADVIAAARPYVIWMSLISLAGAVAFLYDGVYVGLTATRTMRNTMIVAVLLVFLPAYYLTRSAWGNHGLWFAFTLFMLARGVFLGINLRRNLMQLS